MPERPYRVYLATEFASSLFFSLVFTVNILYHVTVVRLDPLQLVLVGTVLEATVFLCEIPTGAVADLRSRKLSIVIGYALIGAGFIVEGSWPVFGAVAVSQVLWGLGYTFTSGATEAWLADELGEERAGPAFLRGAQAATVGRLLGIPLSTLIGRVAITAPIAGGGALMLLLSAALAIWMPEERFQPLAANQRTGWGDIVRTAQDALRLARGRPLLLALLGIGLFYGLYSEGVDRLWSAHLLQDIGLPLTPALDEVTWFGAIQALGSIAGLVTIEVARRVVDTARGASLGRALLVTAAVTALGLAGFALARSFWVSVGLYLAVGALRGATDPLFAAWFNAQVGEPRVRATLFSMSSQVNSVGQVAGGPVIGAIGRALSVPAALLTSALLLAPVAPFYALLLRRGRTAAFEG